MLKQKGESALSEKYVTFVEIFFIIVITTGVSESIGLFSKPFSWSLVLLILGFIVVALSWVFYQQSVKAIPYSRMRKSGFRFLLDVIIAFSYVFLFANVSNVVFFGFALYVVYLLYAIHGCFTVRENGWFTSKWQASSTPSYWALFSLYFLSASYVCSLLQGESQDIIAVFLFALGLVVSRYFRHMKKGFVVSFLGKIGLQQRIAVAVDVDGVLADQVPHVLNRASKEMGISMTKPEITEWDTEVGGVPFTQLIAQYLKDPQFVLTMPTVTGAKEGLQRIRKEANVFVASSRPQETERQTNRWIHTNFGWHTKFKNTTNAGKQNLKANFLVDDYLGNLKGFVEADSTRIGIMLTQPWNVNHDSIKDLIVSGRIIIAMDWNSIVSSFQNLSQET